MDLNDNVKRLIHNVEVLGMPISRAGELAGVSNPHHALKDPRAVAMRASLKATLKSRAQVTREDVVIGIRDAIDQAVLMSDSRAQIMGWSEISKMQGYEKPRAIEINLNVSNNVLKKEVQQLSDTELLRLVDEREVIDADFYELD